MQVNSAIGFLSHAAADDVTNRQCRVPLAFHFTQSCQRIRRFTALCDRKDKRVVSHRWVAVPKLTGVFHFDWDLCKVFHQVLADQRRVPTGAARGENDTFDFSQVLRCQIQTTKHSSRIVLT